MKKDNTQNPLPSSPNPPYPMKRYLSSSAADIHNRAPWLANGCRSFFNDKGERVPTGAMMGRRDCVPEDYLTVREIIVERVRAVDHDYDRGGAYWGGIDRKPLFCAWGDSDTEQAEIFFRADNLRDAKKQARAAFPSARVINRLP